MSAIGWIVSYIVVVVVSALLRGWTLTVLWAWFVMPTFKLPAIGIAPALGISLVVGYLTRQDFDVEQPKRTQGERFARAVGLALLSPALALAFGWVVHLFMGGTA